MGNGVGNLKHCFAGDGGEVSRRRHEIAVYISDPMDEGLGHSFCYVRPDPSSKTNPFSSSDDSCSSTTSSSITTAFLTISGASISANTSTPLSTALVDLGPYMEKAAAFESSPFFSSIPLQPIPRSSISSVRSGPVPGISGVISGPVERGFLSGPIERSFTSGPLDNHELHRFKPKSKKSKLVRNFKKLMSNSNGGNCLSSEGSFGNDVIDEEDEGIESLMAENVQWAQGKAGEDRVHVVISEEHGLIFVGIYDGFNGPDATDFLLQNLYTNVFKELKGVLWNERPETKNTTVPLVINHCDVLKGLSEGLRKTEMSYLEISDLMLKENPELALMGSCVLVMLMKGTDVYLMNVGDSRAVLGQKQECDHSIAKEEALYKALSDRKHNLHPLQLTLDHSTSVTEEVVRIKKEHPDDACAIKNDRVKGSLKVTRAFGTGFLKNPKWNDAILEAFQIEYVGTSPYINCIPSVQHHRLSPRDKLLILSSDGLFQYFTNEEAVSEVETFMSIFPDGDPAQHLIEQVIFKAANKAGMNFHELLDIPQGQRRMYHDDVCIIVISFDGRIWQSSI
ncbi:PREDICTED: probable protein phosphatase 2C 23 [Ipomoea nil]|uniref:probable protein phosphatase 2C 23 n=1 Tax=Ipomoea nil TaxID=35883 RepID=UPI000901E02B|nr:PREDICTED: probable protein phosphatase 2C 23 [Ipomoea nil]XP_019161755.1 PREDICTED: probable protein phosphatase 2C 23 [Ipomoea nil]